MNRPTNVRLRDDRRAVTIIDQTRLPNRTEYVDLETLEEMVDAIFRLKVRGAPAIGIAAAYSYAVLAGQAPDTDYSAFHAACTRYRDALNAARPTAVNLSWALNRMHGCTETLRDLPIPDLRARLFDEACAIQDEDIDMCARIARHGLSVIQDGDGILTHCNAGPLATSLYGTALAPILLGTEEGLNFRVFADETRPLLQGARLTAYELHQAGVDVTLICDNMASLVMKNGWVQACFVGCDRVAANGDAANKIGTSGVAILAKHYGIPFYVLGPTSTIDLACATGADIEIEQRDPEEIRSMWYAEPMAPEGVHCFNPAFDVTDNELITAIITEKGVARAPYQESLARLFD